MAEEKPTIEGAPTQAWALLIGVVIILIISGLVTNTATKHVKVQQARQAQQQVQASSPTEPMVISLTAGVWSDWVELPTVIPGAKVFYLGPKGTQMEYSDGSKFCLDDPTDVGIKFPRFKFLSPTGGEVRIIQKG